MVGSTKMPFHHVVPDGFVASRYHSCGQNYKFVETRLKKPSPSSKTNIFQFLVIFARSAPASFLNKYKFVLPLSFWKAVAIEASFRNQSDIGIKIYQHFYLKFKLASYNFAKSSNTHLGFSFSRAFESCSSLLWDLRRHKLSERDHRLECLYIFGFNSIWK